MICPNCRAGADTQDPEQKRYLHSHCLGANACDCQHKGSGAECNHDKPSLGKCGFVDRFAKEDDMLMLAAEE